jgi:RNA polymerase-binding protein DksA
VKKAAAKAPAKPAAAAKAPPAKPAPAKTPAKAALKAVPAAKAPAKAPAKPAPAKAAAAVVPAVVEAPAVPPKTVIPAKAPGRRGSSAPPPAVIERVERPPLPPIVKAPPPPPPPTAPRARPVKPGSPPEGWTAKELGAVRSELQRELIELQHELDVSADNLDAVRTSQTDSTGDDQADAGAATFEREQEMSLANNSRDLLLQTERALARLDDGTYGICEICGSPIGKKRLQAFPRATLCVTCKAKEERR